MNVTFSYNVVWGPHLGLLLELLAKPKSIYGLAQRMPKESPMDQFSNFWKHMKEEEQEHQWQHAFKRAKQILYKQQTKTGVAIPGNPLPELISDPKFQGDLKVDQLIHGNTLHKQH